MKEYLFAALFASLLLTGCDSEVFSGYHVKPDGENPNQQTETSVTAETPPVTEPALPYDTGWKPADPALNLPVLNLGMTTPEMVQRSVMQTGNRARLAAVMKKAKAKQPVTVACIGGSITQGTGASTSNESYFYRNCAWWAKAFPENAANFNYVNAGIGATGSYIGVHRAERDLLSKHPDVVIVEFSVNDTNPARDLESYDSLVRSILNQPNHPAVMLLFMTQENGTSLADTHSRIGEAYDLPMISYKNAVMPAIGAGRFTWKDISPDNIHPNSNGHGIIGELLWNYYNSVLAELDAINTDHLAFAAEPVGQDKYRNAKLLSAAELTPEKCSGFAAAELHPQFPGNLKTDSAGEISFETDAANIGILYQRTVDGRSGQYDVYVDGEQLKTLDGNFKDGWGNYAEAAEVYAGTAGKHKVTLKKAEASTAEGFGLLGLLVSGGT